MTKAEVISRDYTTSDAYMLNAADLNVIRLQEDLAAITAFDSTINAAFVTAYMAKLANAHGLTYDNVVMAEVKAAGEALEAAMTRGHDKCTEVAYFVRKSFVTKGAQDQFGLNEYEVARRTPERLITYLENLHKECVENQAVLISAGYDATRISEILDIIAELQELKDANNKAQGDRPKTTEERVEILNAVYRTMTTVNAAAQFAFATDAAKRAQYVFDPSADNYDGPGVYDGTLTAGQSVEVVHLKYHADRTMELSNTGTTNLKYFLNGGGLGEQGTPLSLTPGNTVTKTMADMDATGTHLIVKNEDLSVAGAYSVKVLAL